MGSLFVLRRPISEPYAPCREPLQNFFIYSGMVDQFNVGTATRHPLPCRRKMQATRVTLSSERTIDIDDAIAKQLIAEIAGLPAGGARDGEALDPFWQRHRLRLIEMVLKTVAPLPILV